MIRVIHFADVINRYDFIDVIVRRVDPSSFLIGACVRKKGSNIAAPCYGPDIPNWTLGGMSRAWIPLTALRLAGLLRRWRADILHTHHYDQAVIGWLATRLCRTPRLVVGRHYSDAIYRLPHAVRQRRALLVLENAVNRAAALIIVPSKAVADVLVKRQGVPSDKVALVPYAFDPGKCSGSSEAEVRRIRAEFGLDGRFAVGTFSRLHEEKGLVYLIRAAAELRGCVPGLLVLLAGDGPDRAAIERMVREYRVEGTVRLLGHRRDAIAVMSAVDAVVQPSLQEGFSQVMAESMWLGKPLVMTDVSGASDAIRDGENGFIVPCADARALAEAIRRLSADRELCARVGAAGRAFVQQNLAAERVLPRYEECYRRTLA